MSGYREWRERRVATNGVILHCLEAGPDEGPLVVLLHGFPDCARSWRFQAGPLADAGYHVVAPNLRGYDGSSRPEGIEPYRLREVVQDIAGLVTATAPGRAALLGGHDWGGVVAWRLAVTQPSLVQRLAIVNAPHPSLMRRELARNPRQMMRSAYALFFQLPVLPELLLRARGFALLRRAVVGGTRPGTVDATDWEQLRASLEAKGALTAALNYYRAAPLPSRARGERAPARSDVVAQPGVVAWGARDPFLGTRLLDGLAGKAPATRVLRLPDAGHWAHWDAADDVTAAFLDLLRLPARSSPSSAEPR